MARVRIAECLTYDDQQVEEIVWGILDDEYIGAEISGKKEVVIKANLLARKTPEQAVTTHPAVVKAVCKYIIKYGATPIIVDSPAGPFVKGNVGPIYQATGMEEVSKVTGARLNYDFSFSQVNAIEAKMLKHFDVIDVILNSEYVINIAKFKTHGMMTFTGAVKNLYGVIPGLTKANHHFKLQEPQNFGHHLVDICELVKPNFNLIDGIEAMEGDGPSSGITRLLGLMLGSKCPYSLDEVAVNIAGIAWRGVPTIVLAKERMLYDDKNIDCNWELLARKEIPPFILPKSISINFLTGRIPRGVEDVVLKAVRSKPVFIHNKCISCGHCVRNCPPKIISLINGKPALRLKECISCFCCHEVCPADAVKIKKPLISKILFPNRH